MNVWVSKSTVRTNTIQIFKTCQITFVDWLSTRQTYIFCVIYMIYTIFSSGLNLTLKKKIIIMVNFFKIATCTVFYINYKDKIIVQINSSPFPVV